VARDRCRAAALEWRKRCRGAAFETSAASAYELAALAQLGEVGELAELLPALLAAEDERGNLLASVGLRLGLPSILWLAQDRAEEMRATADEWIERWPMAGFSVQHSLHLTTAVQGALYAEEPEDAWRRIERAWAPLRRAGYLRLPHAMVEIRFLRARAALAVVAGVAGRAHGPGLAAADRPPGSVASWIRIASGDAERIARRTDIASAAPYAWALRAAAAGLSGRRDRAGAALEQAAAGFAAASMGLYQAAAEIKLGELRGGEAGRALAREAAERIAARGVRRPDRMAAMLLPGF
jgi:hypothetical protein